MTNDSNIRTNTWVWHNATSDPADDWPVTIVGEQDIDGYVPVTLDDDNPFHVYLVHPMFLREIGA